MKALTVYFCKFVVLIHIAGFDLSTLNLDELERLDVSYLVLPIEAQRVKCSARDKLAFSVLNDKYLNTAPPYLQPYQDYEPNPYAYTLMVAEDDQCVP